jgi:Ras-related protein Rab-1A
VSHEEGQELADHYCVRFLETSAKDSKNVEQAFTTMTREIKNKVAVQQPSKPGPKTASVTVTSNTKKVQGDKKGCC